MDTRLLRAALALQGAYYTVTGLWGLLHFPSFQAVVGPKPDRFQFQTTSLLITLLGGTFLAAALRRRPDPLFGLAAGAAALALAGVETAHLGRIRKVFLLDTAAEVGLAGLTGAGLLAAHRGRKDAGAAGLKDTASPADTPSATW